MASNPKTPVAQATSTKVVTDEVTLGYVKLVTPWSMDPNAEPMYSAMALIRKTDVKTVAAIQAACQAAAQNGASKYWGGKVPAGLRMPLRDGDTERDGDEYKGCFFVNARSKQKPRVVDVNRQDIIDPDEIYSGAVYRVVLNFYPYNVNGNRGIGCGLGNVQKIRDGERLGGGSSVEQDFADTSTEYLA
jgi:hypothetical protein